MNILVMTKSDLEKGSTKYRIAQYADVLKAKGINLDFVKRHDIDGSLIDRVRRYDVVINQRCLFRTSLAKKIIANTSRIVFDFDDAIYTRSGNRRPLLSRLTAVRKRHRLHLWLRRANVVTTANSVLAEYARRYSSHVVVIPMAIDLEVWRPQERVCGTPVTIGWAGSPATVRNIERLESVLAEVLRRNPSIRLAIFSGRRPRLNCPFEYYPFQPGREPEFVKNLDIGLLPLSDDEYSRGKSPIKAIQYLACGVPVVANVIGATAEILNRYNSICVSSEEDWIRALETLIGNRQLAKSMGRAGREFVLQHHNARLTAQRLLEIVSGDISFAENITD